VWDHGICSPGPIFAVPICCMFALKEARWPGRWQGMILSPPSSTWTCAPSANLSSATDSRPCRRKASSWNAGRVHSIAPTPGSDDVAIRWTSATGEIQEKRFDLVVLSVGQRANDRNRRPMRWTGCRNRRIRLRQNRTLFPTPAPDGRGFAGGTLTGPTDIAESMIARLFGSRQRIADDSPRRGRAGRKNSHARGLPGCIAGAAAYPGGALPLHPPHGNG
jgi:hypothetical protein